MRSCIILIILIVQLRPLPDSVFNAQFTSYGPALTSVVVLVLVRTSCTGMTSVKQLFVSEENISLESVFRQVKIFVFVSYYN